MRLLISLFRAIPYRLIKSLRNLICLSVAGCIHAMARDGQAEKAAKLAGTSVKALGMLAEKFKGVAK